LIDFKSFETLSPDAGKRYASNSEAVYGTGGASPAPDMERPLSSVKTTYLTFFLDLSRRGKRVGAGCFDDESL